jgi:hypothetical protein
MTTPGDQWRPDQRHHPSLHQFHSIDPRPPRLRPPYKPPPRSLVLAFIFSQRSNHSHDWRGAYSRTAHRAAHWTAAIEYVPTCARAVRRPVYFGPRQIRGDGVCRPSSCVGPLRARPHRIFGSAVVTHGRAIARALRCARQRSPAVADASCNAGAECCDSERDADASQRLRWNWINIAQRPALRICSRGPP